MNVKYIISDPDHIFALRQLDKFMIGHSGFIAGGCFKNIFNNEPIKDIDVFFKSESDFDKAVKYFNGSDDFEPYYESKNVTAFRHKDSHVSVELVQTIFGTPEEVISKFDFTVVKFAYYKEEVEDELTYKAIYHKHFFEHLHLKRAIVDDEIPKPMSTFNRLLKYRKYGYVPCVETKQKVINALRSLPENEILVPTNFYEGID